MVPTVALPEATPLTYQVTAWFVFPGDWAVNWVLSPARIVTLEG